jgi:two-component system, chemotaxis family, chemotaxis protein CheY
MRISMPFSDDFTVMVIEDNDYSRMTIADFLDEGGVKHVVEAADGEEAVAALREQRIDLIICDIVMEPMDGWAFIDHLQSQGIKTPVIILTGQEDPETIEMARARQVHAYLSKPISKRRLLEKVQEIVGV